MTPIEPTLRPEDGKNEFQSKFRWYLDNIGEPSRRQSLITLSKVLDIPKQTLDGWVRRNTPNQWRFILEKLEAEYGPCPDSVWNEKEER